MKTNWISKAKDAWKRSDRLRAGIRAGLKASTIVVGSVRAINSVPVPPQPSVARTEETPITRHIEKEGIRQLKDYASFEIIRRTREQDQLIDDLPKHAARVGKSPAGAGGRGAGADGKSRTAAERTTRAVQSSRSPGDGGRPQGRGR